MGMPHRHLAHAFPSLPERGEMATLPRMSGADHHFLREDRAMLGQRIAAHLDADPELIHYSFEF